MQKNENVIFPLSKTLYSPRNNIIIIIIIIITIIILGDKEYFLIFNYNNDYLFRLQMYLFLL